MKELFSLKGRVALVTGASYGIGFAIATGFANAGATIVFNDLRQELVDRGIAAYRELGIEAHGYVCDVTDEAAVGALIRQIEEDVGPVDILVNNAGIIKRIPMIEMTAEQFRQVIDVDLNAPFIVSKAVLPSMKRLLSLAEPPTAVIATNDLMAAGALQAILRLGYSVPNDFSIVGFDDSLITDLTEPNISSVHYDYAAYAKKLIDTALAAIAGEPCERTCVIPTSLTVKESCRKVDS